MKNKKPDFAISSTSKEPNKWHFAAYLLLQALVSSTVFYFYYKLWISGVTLLFISMIEILTTFTLVSLYSEKKHVAIFLDSFLNRVFPDCRENVPEFATAMFIVSMFLLDTMVDNFQEFIHEGGAMLTIVPAFIISKIIQQRIHYTGSEWFLVSMVKKLMINENGKLSIGKLFENIALVCLKGISIGARVQVIPFVEHIFHQYTELPDVSHMIVAKVIFGGMQAISLTLQFVTIYSILTSLGKVFSFYKPV